MVTYLLTLFAFYFPAGLDPLHSAIFFDFIIRFSGVTLMIPLVVLGLLRILGSVQSITLVKRKERIIPFFFMSVMYTAIIIMLATQQRISLHDNLLKFLIITDALVIVSFLTTLFYKVSVHSLATWGFVGILLPLGRMSEDGALFYPVLISILVAGLVMSSRLTLQVHTVREVWLGAVLGIGVSFFGMTILFY